MSKHGMTVKPSAFPSVSPKGQLRGPLQRATPVNIVRPQGRMLICPSEVHLGTNRAGQ